MFSGAGGFDLAAGWMGWENVFQVEINSFCQKVLEKNFPNTKRYGNIKDFDGREYTGRIDILSGGDPCQPSSTAGLNRGVEDPRFLWPEYFRIVKVIRPKVCVNENVSGSIANRILDQKISDLESEGYTCWPPLLIPSGASEALHRRDRVWLVAYSDGIGSQTFSEQLEKGLRSEENQPESTGAINPLLRPSFPRGTIEKLFTGEPPLVRTDNGIPKELDAIAAIGNSADPRIILEIFKAIDLIRKHGIEL